MLQTLNFNGPRQINAAATFFRYESGSAGGADESIRVRADGQDLGIYWPGDAVELPVQRTTWDIIPTTQTTAGVLRLGNGRVSSARLVGTVRIIDGERDKVTAGQAFRMIAQATTGAAGTAMLQAWNPVGSGKNVYINGVSIGSSAADNYTAFTTTTPNNSFAIKSRSLDVSAVDGITESRFDNTNQSLLNPRSLASGYLQASADRELRFVRPVLLRPGYGLTIQAATVTTTLRATWDIEEV